MKKEIKSGTYKILNNSNGKVYYGSSKDLNGRKRDHFTLLKTNKHFNRHLQFAYNENSNIFEFIILNECDESLLLAEEQKLLDEFWDGSKNCYNISKDASCPTRGRCGELHFFFGKHHKAESKEKMRQVKLGRYRGTEHSRYGKEFPKSAKEKLRQIKKNPIFCIELNQEFLSIYHASEVCGLSHRTIGRSIKENKTKMGHTFIKMEAI